MGVDGSGLSRSERGVCFIDVVGVGAGRSQWWVHLPVNVIRRGRNVRSRARKRMVVQRSGAVSIHVILVVK